MVIQYLPSFATQFYKNHIIPMKGLERYLSVLYQKFAAYCDTLIVNERIDELGLENDTNLILLSLYEVYIMIQREQIPIDKQLYQNVYIYDITID